ncbi:MAG: universal stress protein [Anaerolineae bacterium]|nr:universal stress protein [Anaerolineae bacterium]
MFKKILLPLDSSDLAESALPTAVQLAERFEGELVLLHVLEHHTVFIPEVPDMMSYNLNFPESAFSREEIAAREYLTGINHTIGAGQPNFNCYTRLEDGDPASRILDTAVDEKADLIVMSTHGYSGVTRWVLGSVAEKVMRHASCPVLVIRSQTPIHQVLITLDGSPLAEASLLGGLAVAQALGADVTLLGVENNAEVVDAKQVLELNRGEPGLGERYRQSLYQGTEEYLANIQRQYRRDDLVVDTAVRYGKPAPTILTYAETHHIDLIVMSTHGRSGLARWRYGSVTEKVLRSANCAMLISRPDFSNQ